jgi:uncharacterized protein DUF2637
VPDPMSDQQTARPAEPGDGPGTLRIAGLAAVGVGLAALAGAAFVLSYPGIHAFALQAGISARLARGYPLILDVLLVVILAAVLALRGAGLPSKLFAWTCLIAVLAAAGGADAMHADGRRLPAHAAAITAAIVPWALVLVALALLLAMLRHARLRHMTAPGAAVGGDAARPQWEPHKPPPPSTRPLVPGFPPAEPPVTARAAPGAGGAAPVPARATPAKARPTPSDSLPLATPRLVVPRQVTAGSAADTTAVSDADLAIDAQLTPDDPSSDETALDPAGEPEPAPGADAAVTGAGTTDEGAEAEPEATVPATAAADDPNHDADGRSHPDEDGVGDPDEDGVGDADPEGMSDPQAEDTADPGTDAASDPDTATDPEMPVFHRMWSAPTPPSGTGG